MIRTALEQAVVARPDDEAAWSVLADQLLDQGDPLGALIALRHTPDIDTLRARGLAELEPFLASGMLAVEWHHGVPAHARFGDGSASAPTAQLLEALRRFTTLPVTRFVSELEVYQPAIEAISIIARGTCADSVRTLVLPGRIGSGGAQRWGSAEATELAASPLIERLVKLDLRDHRISIRGAEALANAPASALEELHLFWNAIGPAGATALAASTRLPRLRLLDLSSNLLGNTGFEALAALGANVNGSLRELGLRTNGGTSAGGARLCSSPIIASLEALWLSDNALGDGALAALVESRHAGRLCRLDLSGTEITDDGVAYLAGSALLGQLTELDLSGNRLGDASMIALASSPYSAALRVLNVSEGPQDLFFEAPLSDAGLIAIANSPYLGNLRVLGLPLLTQEYGDGIKAVLASPTLSASVKQSLCDQLAKLHLVAE